MSAWTSKGIVAWSDTDASGRSHFTAAHRWAENAEHELYRPAVPSIDIGRFPRRATSAAYERPLVAGTSTPSSLTRTWWAPRPSRTPGACSARTA